jgi:hypothetical protein
LIRRFVNRAARRPLLALVLLSSLLVPVGASAASAPGNVKVFPNPPGQVCVSWNAVDGANQYKIYDGGGNFIQIAGTAATPKCMPSDFGTCFAVSATTNSGETARSAAVCTSAPAQTSATSGQQVLGAATSSVSGCIPYPGNVFTIPNQPSIFCDQATQGYVVCGGGGGGGRDIQVSGGGGGTYTDGNTFGDGYDRTSGGGGRDCELDSGAINGTASSNDVVSQVVMLYREYHLDTPDVQQIRQGVSCIRTTADIGGADLVVVSIDLLNAQNGVEAARVIPDDVVSTILVNTGYLPAIVDQAKDRIKGLQDCAQTFFNAIPGAVYIYNQVVTQFGGAVNCWNNQICRQGLLNPENWGP